MNSIRRFLGWLLVCCAGVAAAQDLAVVSSGAFRSGPLSPGSIVTAFGQNLAGSQPAEIPIPLATELVGTSVRITDSAGVQLLCGLYFVSPTQINFVIPDEAALGSAVITVLRDGQEAASGPVTLEGVAPEFYALGGNLGIGAMFRIAADGTQSTVRLFEFVNGEVVSTAFSLGPSGDQLLLVLLGTGYRGSEVAEMRIGSALLESNALPTLFTGELQGLPGIDQVISNVLPRRLEDFGGGIRDVRLDASAPGMESPRESNVVKVAFAPNPDAPVLTRAQVSGTQRSNGGVRIGWSIDFQDSDADLGPLRIHLLLTAEAGFCLTRLDDNGVPGQTSGTYTAQLNSNAGEEIGSVRRADVSLRDEAGHSSAFYTAELSGDASWRVPCAFFIKRFGGPSPVLLGPSPQLLEQVEGFISRSGSRPEDLAEPSPEVLEKVQEFISEAGLLPLVSGYRPRGCR